MCRHRDTKEQLYALRSSPLRVAYPRYLLAFFASTPLWNETAMHAHCPLVPFYLSLSFVISPPSYSTEAECRSNPLPFPPSLFRWFFFLSLASSSNPTSPPSTSSFSSATLPSLPHLLFSYQPGRTRIHILQAFMMAAAHLCEPACWVASSLPRAGSSPSNQSDTGSAQAKPALSLFGYNLAPFRCIVEIINLFNFYIFYDSIKERIIISHLIISQIF